ncbi:MAG: nucleoside monophosphate kinase [Candidatus Kaiserbacteria bacterium]|nr:nucleoside monophosphate kinase [Candidatus Kaiserbacteria bacterium]MCB9816719.1 nucleoside monophosphate kinase [Candidatus Nomurabacteria bacterium]
MQPTTVIFIGPQGSGKGTQIELLYKVMTEKDPARRVVDIQTGRRFRALAAKHETFAERKINATLDSGVLQPDFLTHVLWGQAMLDQLDAKSHLLIDGFPRTVPQAEVLDDALAFFERDMLHVINLDTPEEVVRKRMYERARADDTDESIEERLRWYREETLPVLDYYRVRPDTEVHDLEGTDTIEGVHAQILTALKLT